MIAFLKRIAAAGFVFAGFAAPAGAMSYSLLDAELPNCKGPCPKVIYASGTIQENEDLNFSAYIREAMTNHKISKILLIDSGGGVLDDAMALGRVVRKLKMQVMVGRPSGGAITQSAGLIAGTCASACSVVLMGGTKRSYIAGSRIGVHRSNNGGDTIDPITRKIASFQLDHAAILDQHIKYFRMMGIDPALAKLIDATPSEKMHWLSPEELKRYRVAEGSTTTH